MFDADSDRSRLSAQCSSARHADPGCRRCQVPTSTPRRCAARDSDMDAGNHRDRRPAATRKLSERSGAAPGVLMSAGRGRVPPTAALAPSQRLGNHSGTGQAETIQAWPEAGSGRVARHAPRRTDESRARPQSVTPSTRVKSYLRVPRRVSLGLGADEPDGFGQF